jgi:GT2 family glycosyltransferase
MCRVAFYEVSQPFRPNTLVDITGVMDTKLDAIRLHESQMSIRDYAHFARGLNAYRAMTLSSDAQYAEAYCVVDATELRLEPIARLAARMSAAPPAAMTSEETLPIAVLVRTKDRPQWLREALDSIRATGYPAKTIVVNDGGTSPRDFIGEGVTLIDNERSLGRSEAMNVAARAAESSTHLAFLDDDDLYYPDHLETLARAARGGSHRAVYTDAVSAFYSMRDAGRYECDQRLRIFAQDYDRELLLCDNYIPLPTLLVSRSDFLELGGFDREFDLFEDWDFIIRLSMRGTLLRIPKVTCEIRHFSQSSSAVLSSPEGSDAFRKAKLAVWRKHRELVTYDVLAGAVSKMKDRANLLLSEATEARGRGMHLEKDVTRLTREKSQAEAVAGAVTERARELELAIESAQATIRLLHDTEAQLHSDIGELTATLKQTLEENKNLALELERYRIGNEHLATTQAALQGEVDRLNGLLQTIFGSRTWKMHTLVQKLKGRS